MAFLGQNPKTGFIYMVKPEFRHIPHADGVRNHRGALAQIRYLQQRPIALLLWAVARMTTFCLFNCFVICGLESRRRRPAANGVNRVSVFSSKRGRMAAGIFRHENYFQAIRRIQLPEDDRRAVVEILFDLVCAGKASWSGASVMYRLRSSLKLRSLT